MSIAFTHYITIGLTQKLSEQLDALIAEMSESAQVAEIAKALEHRAVALEALGNPLPTS